MDPQKTALILIGYQNEYFSAEGVLREAIEASSQATQILANTCYLVDELRDTPVLLITTPIVFAPDYRELVDPIGILKSIKEAGAFQAGTIGAETIPELKAYGERIVEISGKFGLNAFSNTNLASLLRAHDITEVVIAGVVTSICVDSTARSAVELGFKTTILSDCTSGRSVYEQDFFCENIFPLYANVVDHKALLHTLSFSRTNSSHLPSRGDIQAQISHRLFEELAATEQRYRTLVEIRNVVFKYDQHGCLTFVNPAWEDLLGYPIEDTLGRPLTDFLCEEDREKGLALVTIGPQTPKSRSDKLRFCHSRGHARWFDVSLSLSDDGEGVGLLYDITEQQAEEEQLQHTLRRTKAIAKSTSDFLSTMSHEIRTPMNGVLGMTELLLTTELNEKQKQYVEAISVSGEFLLALLDDILDLSKLESGKMSLKRQPLNIPHMMKSLYELFLPETTAKGLRLDFVIKDDVPVEIQGDITRLRQILINLIGNAVKFTDRGEVEISIHKTSQAMQTLTLLFSVKDTGIGISPEKQFTLFEAFTQVVPSTAREYGGTGLGLNICSKLVTLMNGRIWVESQAGQGTTVSFTIKTKALTEKSSDKMGQETSPRLDPQLATHFPARILVAEDDPINQQVIIDMLAAMGYRADIVETGIDVVKRLNTHQYDVIFMDIKLPEMDGIQTTQHIFKIMPPERRPWIIALTANVLQENRERCLAIGMSDFITKPINPRALQSALTRRGTQVT